MTGGAAAGTLHHVRMIGWVLLLSILPFRASAVDLPTIVEQIRGEVNPLESMEYMRRIYSTDRWFTFPKFAETAQYEA
ncbi:MAG: hypothetical protein ACRETL_12825, partial [Gammaproteobacteria bacterium]